MSDGNDRKPGEQEARADAAIVDPMATWRSFSNATMDSWAKTMVQWVNTDDFAKSTGALLNAYMEASHPQKQIYEQMMTRALAQSNMPSREDILSLAERLTHIEMRLDDIDAKLDLAIGRPAEPGRAAAPDVAARASVKKSTRAKKKTIPGKRK
ncbi:MAG: hypothetical protein H0X25_13045 [Acidobacteriales bacterium]|nr:hypothetical protein [Terriglobales bacterium]